LMLKPYWVIVAVHLQNFVFKHNNKNTIGEAF
jgi:hypothetical protein